jgi:hypothetical protein
MEAAEGPTLAQGAFLGLRTVPSCRSGSRITVLIRAAVAPVVKPLAGATRFDIDADFGRRRRMHRMQSRREFLATLSAAGPWSMAPQPIVSVILGWPEPTVWSGSAVRPGRAAAN